MLPIVNIVTLIAAMHQLKKEKRNFGSAYVNQTKTKLNSIQSFFTLNKLILSLASAI